MKLIETALEIIGALSVCATVLFVSIAFYVHRRNNRDAVPTSPDVDLGIKRDEI